MIFIDKYPTTKTSQEEEMELKMELVSLVSTALKKTSEERRKTSEERKDKLILTSNQIETIISKVREFNFENSKAGVATLEGIIEIALLDVADDPEIKSILSQQLEIYRAKQLEFKNSEECIVAQEIYKTHPSVMEKIMKAFDIERIDKKEDGTLDFYCKCDDSKFIARKNDNAIIKTKGGKTTIEMSNLDQYENVME